MRVGCPPRACRSFAAWRVVALTTVLGMATAVLAVSEGIASASLAPHRYVPNGAHTVPGPGLTLAQAPAGLRAAVLRTLGIPAAVASSASRQAVLTAPDGASGDGFGGSVAISGHTAVVGGPGHSSDTGAAYVFVRSGTAWSQQAELTVSPSTSRYYFGYSAAISGSTAVVGAPRRKGFTGAAYAFVNV
jgi:hypothetical protein